MWDQVSPAQLPRNDGWLGDTRPPRCGTNSGSIDGGSIRACQPVELGKSLLGASLAQLCQFAREPLQVHAAAVDVGVRMPQTGSRRLAPARACDACVSALNCRVVAANTEAVPATSTQILPAWRRRRGTKRPCPRSRRSPECRLRARNAAPTRGAHLANDACASRRSAAVSPGECRTCGRAVASHRACRIVRETAEMQIALVDERLRGIQSAQSHRRIAARLHERGDSPVSLGALVLPPEDLGAVIEAGRAARLANDLVTGPLLASQKCSRLQRVSNQES